MGLETVFLIVIIIYSIVIHEAAHGFAANYLGDPTARYEGRLTLNPIKHLDPVGSVLLPAIFAFTHAPFFFGWAKPVPYNPYNLRGRYGELWVALAGPASNLFLALIFGLLMRAAPMLGLPADAMQLMFFIVETNIMLALFNMIPIPPLDGSKVLSGILPYPLQQGYDSFRQMFEYNPMLGFGLVIVFVYLFSGLLGAVAGGLAAALAGM